MCTHNRVTLHLTVMITINLMTIVEHTVHCRHVEVVGGQSSYRRNGSEELKCDRLNWCIAPTVSVDAPALVDRMQEALHLFARGRRGRRGEGCSIASDLQRRAVLNPAPIHLRFHAVT